MSKVIEIRLNDVQHAALTAAVEASGLKFFDYCRHKLMAGLTPVSAPQDVPKPVFVREEVSPAPAASTKPVKAVAPVREPDRIDRLEAMLLHMAENFDRLAHPRIVGDVQSHEASPEIDIDGIVDQSLHLAESQGMTVVEREPVAAPAGVRHVGTRPPLPFSPQTQPRHLLGLGGGQSG